MNSTVTLLGRAALCALAIAGCRSSTQPPAPRTALHVNALDAAAPIDAGLSVATRDGSAADASDARVIAANDEPSIEHELEPEIETCERPRTLPLPTVPPELAAEVLRYRRIVQRTQRCYHTFFRVRMRPPAQCEQWFRTLDAGGIASMHAIGVELTTPERGEYSCRTPYISAALSRLARTLGRSEDPAAMLYLMRAVSLGVAYGPEYSEDAEFKAYEGLLHLAGGDVQSRVPPITDRNPGLVAGAESEYVDSDPDDWQLVLNSWARYYLAHRGETPAQWRERNLAANRSALRIDGGYPAFVAAIVLWERADDRPVVRALFERAIRASADLEQPNFSTTLTSLAAERRVMPNRWTFRWQ